MKIVPKIIIIGFTLIIFFFEIDAQEYFQQKVDFNISATLDTEDQVLTSNCKLKYTNNSSDELNEVILHIYWNAYQSKTTAFAQQKLQNFQRDFHFADYKQLGGYNQLEIHQQGQLTEFTYYENDGKKYQDIIKVNLNTPCKAGESIELEIDYSLKIPYAFSRAGLADDVFRFTQWYPKPAVYDKEGWHPMAYQDIGEFYYDFGDYEVEVSIPTDYVIGHTGTLISDEIADGKRTIKTTASNVSDYAWFTSNKYEKVSRTIYINDDSIQLNVYKKWNNYNWDNALDFLERSVRFFSNKIGPYPYPQVSVAEGSLSRGGGMEYPMITLIEFDAGDKALDYIIAHEIGHNWFYGILGSNERIYPWMDEGLNSFFDRAYISNFYGEPMYENTFSQKLKDEKQELGLLQLLIFQLQSSNRDVPINTPSTQMDMFTYAAMSYEKTAWSFKYLEGYLGLQVFEQCVQSYYDIWKFKHPGPEDLKAIFESVSGKNLDWFFDGVIKTKKRWDFRFKGVRKTDEGVELSISNNGKLAIPFHITAYNEKDSILFNRWYDSDETDQLVTVAIPEGNYNRISINGKVPFLDINRKNNHYYPGRRFHNNRIKPEFLFKVSDSKNQKLLMFPSIAINAYDGLMIGTHLSSELFPLPSTRWFVNANYGLKSKSPSGLFALEKDFMSGHKNIRKLTLGISGKQFHYFENEASQYDLKYWKLVPSVEIQMARSISNNQSIKYSAHFINEEDALFADYPDGTRDITINSKHALIHQLTFSADWHRRLVDSKLKTELEFEKYSIDGGDQKHYLKFVAEIDKSTYISKESRFFWRFFASYFILNTERESSNYQDIFTHGSIALTDQGYTDNTYEQLYLGRSHQSGLWSRQINISDGGFKTAFGSSQKIGLSNNWAVMLNLKTDIPYGLFKKVKLRPFVDLAIVNNKRVSSDPLNTNFFYSGGFAFEIGNSFGIYFPLINSKELESVYESTGFWSRFSFRINLNQLNLWKVIDQPVFLLK